VQAYLIALPVVNLIANRDNILATSKYSRCGHRDTGQGDTRLGTLRFVGGFRDRSIVTNPR
jgi:hypothetical protein